jgi:hypothetical protein
MLPGIQMQFAEQINGKFQTVLLNQPYGIKEMI